MKRLLAVVLVAWCGSAVADELSRADKQRLAAYYTLHVVDWGQTRHAILEKGREEKNPILGKHPTSGEINRYFIVTGALYLGAVHLLPPGPRKWFQYTTIAIEAGYVQDHYRVGVRVDF